MIKISPKQADFTVFALTHRVLDLSTLSTPVDTPLHVDFLVEKACRHGVENISHLGPTDVTIKLSLFFVFYFIFFLLLDE